MGKGAARITLGSQALTGHLGDASSQRYSDQTSANMSSNSLSNLLKNTPRFVLFLGFARLKSLRFMPSLITLITIAKVAWVAAASAYGA